MSGFFGGGAADLPYSVAFCTLQGDSGTLGPNSFGIAGSVHLSTGNYEVTLSDTTSGEWVVTATRRDDPLSPNPVPVFIDVAFSSFQAKFNLFVMDITGTSVDSGLNVMAMKLAT